MAIFVQHAERLASRNPRGDVPQGVRVYTGVVHPYMMQQVAKVPPGSTPMKLDASRQKPLSPQTERPPVGSGYPLLTGMDAGTTERMESYPRRSDNYPRDYQRSERRWETRRREEESLM